jgi:lipoprotein-anchoring transpeptidase ErfK/SrfK
MAKLKRLGFTGPLEALAERFHMDQDLLQALNPGADFGRAGTRIVVAATGGEALPAPVERVEVDKAAKQVRAYAADGRLLAAYPATVGSEDLPTPSGELAVRTIAPDPTWTYDPSKLHFGDRSAGKLTIAAGPNNPVGEVWIDLTRDTYGIHGAPDPELVGKTASHGCVRLTNWDAEQLARSIAKGARVTFLGTA